MFETSKFILKTFALVGLIGTAKILSVLLPEDEKEKQPEESSVKVTETDLSKVISDIRNEMNFHMMETKEEEKLLRNYIRGRIATLDDLENKLK